MIDTNTLLSVVGLILAVVATLLGKKWQDALSDAADITAQTNKLIVAAKDNNVDETAFQAIVDDVHKFLNG